jgi:(R,R)-butanediol dehydrogenase/meso-butanediol dehydrogenase/diacetyl reductase
MRAARFHGVRDIRVEEVPEPDGDLAPTQVLIEPQWCGICGTDLHEYLAGPIVTPATPHPLNGSELPQIMGHELAGDVLAVGSDVGDLRVGDRVSVMPLAYCGSCAFCVRGMNHLCTRMACFGLSDRWGGFATRGVVERYQAWRLPDAVSYEQGALIEPAAVAAYGASRGRVAPGDRVLVTGGGPIGALSVLAAYAAGAGEVYLAEPNARRRERAANLGAAAIYDPSQEDVVARLQEVTDGLGVDVALECSGSEAGLQTAINAVRTRGTVAQVGLHVGLSAIDPMRLAEREISLVGVWAYDVHEWPRIMAQIASGRFPVEKVVSDRIGLDEIVSGGFEVLTDPTGDQTKILVAPR